MAAPDTSSYILASPDSVALPQSRTLLAAGGLVLQDTGAAGNVTINTVGNLANLNQVSVGGYINYDTSSNTFQSITFLAGTGINITNANGQDGASTFSVQNNTTIQRVQVAANGLVLSTRDTLDFIPEGNLSITVTDNPGSGRSEVRIINNVSPLAPSDATYIVQTPDARISSAQALSALSPGGILKSNSEGVVSIASPTSDYQPYSINLNTVANPGPAGSFLTSTGFTAVWAAGPIPASQGGTGLSSPNNHGIMVSNATSPMSSVVLTNNQVLLGSTGNAPVATTLIAGENIVFDQSTPGQLTINSSNAGGMEVMVVPPGTTSVTLQANTWYLVDGLSGTVNFTYPASPEVGDVYKISGNGGPSGYQVRQLAGQVTRFGTLQTTNGTDGRIYSSFSNPWDTIEIMFTPSGMFSVTASTGNLYLQ